MPRICQPINVLKLTNVSVVRLRDGANTFELACYPNKVTDWREGKEKDITEVLQSDKIFSCVGKGQFARDAELISTFGTTEFHVCVKKILSEGTVQIAPRERKLLQENFEKEVFDLVGDIVHTYCGHMICRVPTETLRSMAKAARLMPKLRNKLTAKPCATLLAQNLVKYYPKQIYITALRAQITFPDVEAAKKCYHEFLGRVPWYRIVHETDEEVDEPAAKTVDNPESAEAKQPVTLSLYMHRNHQLDVQAYCTSNGLNKLKITMIMYQEMPNYLGTNTLPEFLEETDGKSKAPKATDPAANGAASDCSASSSSESSDLEDEDETDPEEDAEAVLLKGRRERMQDMKAKEKKIRSKERKQKEKEKLLQLSTPPPSEASVVQIKAPDEYTEEEMKSATWCDACKVDYGKSFNQQIRQHVKTEWHVFNQKRAVRKQTPVSLSVFEELSRDLKEGFLAVES